jgi:hypothetical protein
MSVQAENSKSCPFVSSSGYNGSLVIWTAVVCLTAAKLLPRLIILTLKMKAICSSETSVDTQRTTRRYIPAQKSLVFEDM